MERGHAAPVHDVSSPGRTNSFQRTLDAKIEHKLRHFASRRRSPCAPSEARSCRFSGSAGPSIRFHQLRYMRRARGLPVRRHRDRSLGSCTSTSRLTCVSVAALRLSTTTRREQNHCRQVASSTLTVLSRVLATTRSGLASLFTSTAVTEPGIWPVPKSARL